MAKGDAVMRPRTYMKRYSKEPRPVLKSWARGAREQVLGPHIIPYGQARDRGWDAEREYIARVFNEFHFRISWRLSDEEEPPLPLPPYNPDAIAEPEILSEDDQLDKIERIKLLNQRIRRWLKYRVKKHRMIDANPLDPRRNPYALLLAQLSGLRSPPKARQAYQQFMRERWAQDIEGPMKKAWAIKARDERLDDSKSPNAAFRAKIARDIFSKLPAAEQNKWAQKARSEARIAKEKYEKSLSHEGPESAEEMQRCIDNIPSFLAPIMKGVQAKTKQKFFLLYGGPEPANDCEISANHINYGLNRQNDPKYFFQWDREHFDAEVFPYFKQWLGTAYTKVDFDEIADLAKQPNANDASGALSSSNEGEPFSSAPKPPITSQPGSDSGESDSDSSPSSGSDDEDELTGPILDRSLLGDAIRKHASKYKKKKASNSPHDAANPADPLSANGLKKRKRLAKKMKVAHTTDATSSATQPDATMDVDPPQVASDTMDIDEAAGTEPPGSIDSNSTSPRQPSVESNVRATPPASATAEPPSTPVTNGPLAQATLRRSPTPFNQLTPPDSPPRRSVSRHTTPAVQRSDSAPPGKSPIIQPVSQTGSGTTSTPGLTDPTIQDTTPVKPSLPDHAPKWFVDAFNGVGEHDLGGEWTTLLKLFLEIESAHEFKNPRNGLSTKKRPAEIHKWVAAGRWRGRDPTIGNPAAFSEAWWTWWGTLQPEWRTLIGGRPAEREQYGENWDPLMFPGQNGILSIIAGLSWWGNAVKSGEGQRRASWSAAVADVIWMFTGLAAFLKHEV